MSFNSLPTTYVDQQAAFHRQLLSVRTIHVLICFTEYLTFFKIILPTRDIAR